MTEPRVADLSNADSQTHPERVWPLVSARLEMAAGELRHSSKPADPAGSR